MSRKDKAARSTAGKRSTSPAAREAPRSEVAPAGPALDVVPVSAAGGEVGATGGAPALADASTGNVEPLDGVPSETGGRLSLAALADRNGRIEGAPLDVDQLAEPAEPPEHGPDSTCEVCNTPGKLDRIGRALAAGEIQNDRAALSEVGRKLGIPDPATPADAAALDFDSVALGINIRTADGSRVDPRDVQISLDDWKAADGEIDAAGGPAAWAAREGIGSSIHLTTQPVIREGDPIEGPNAIPDSDPLLAALARAPLDVEPEPPPDSAFHNVFETGADGSTRLRPPHFPEADGDPAPCPGGPDQVCCPDCDHSGGACSGCGAPRPCNSIARRYAEALAEHARDLASGGGSIRKGADRLRAFRIGSSALPGGFGHVLRDGSAITLDPTAGGASPPVHHADESAAIAWLRGKLAPEGT